MRGTRLLKPDTLAPDPADDRFSLFPSLDAADKEAPLVLGLALDVKLGSPFLAAFQFHREMDVWSQAG